VLEANGVLASVGVLHLPTVGLGVDGLAAALASARGGPLNDWFDRWLFGRHWWSASTKPGVTVKESREYVTHPFIYVTDVTQGVCWGCKKPRQPAPCRVKKDRRRTGLSPSEGRFFAGAFYSPGTLCVTPDI